MLKRTNNAALRTTFCISDTTFGMLAGTVYGENQKFSGESLTYAFYFMRLCKLASYNRSTTALALLGEIQPALPFVSDKKRCISVPVLSARLAPWVPLLRHFTSEMHGGHHSGQLSFIHSLVDKDNFESSIHSLPFIKLRHSICSCNDSFKHMCLRSLPHLPSFTCLLCTCFLRPAPHASYQDAPHTTWILTIRISAMPGVNIVRAVLEVT